MHIHKMITIKSICISPSNFFTQLTQEIILNINSTKKEKRLREEGPKIDEEGDRAEIERRGERAESK